MNRIISYIIAFTSGAAVMIFELAGTRILAPYFGNSLPVWTSIIGVILASLSLGYYVGGLLADRELKKKVLSRMIMASMIAVAWCASFSYLILGKYLVGLLGINAGAIFSSILLFAPAGITLGMITPYLARLNIHSLDKSGSTIGNLYAMSTLGSIIGTFLAGLVLIPHFGTVQILYALCVGLFLLYLLNSIGDRTAAVKALIFLFFITAIHLFTWGIWHAREVNLIDDIDTAYSRYFIYEGKYGEEERDIRYFITDPYGIQGAVFLSEPNELVLDYQKFFRLHKHFAPDSKRALILGGGVMSMARDYMNYSSGELDVVEIDPELLNISGRYFGYEANDRIAVYAEDARWFLSRTETKYDCIFVDAYGSNLSIPFHLTTREALSEMYRNLNENGVVILNIISGINGEKARFFQAEYETFKDVFDEVRVFQVDSLRKPEEAQNLIITAFRGGFEGDMHSENDELEWYLKHLVDPILDDNRFVLTDDYAPVDYLLMKIF